MGELITDVKTLSGESRAWPLERAGGLLDGSGSIQLTAMSCLDLPTKETHFVPETTINTHDNHNGPITSSMEMAPKEEHSGDRNILTRHPNRKNCVDLWADVFQITVILPHQPYEIQVTVRRSPPDSQPWLCLDTARFQHKNRSRI